MHQVYVVTYQWRMGTARFTTGIPQVFNTRESALRVLADFAKYPTVYRRVNMYETYLLD